MRTARNISRAVAVVLLMAACTNQADGITYSDSGAMTDSLSQARAKFAMACMEKNAIAVSWNGDTALGVPAKMFANLEGTCTAPLQWDARTIEKTSLTPLTGNSKLTVTLKLDQKSARIVNPAHEPEGPAVCEGVLLVDGQLLLASADGVFSDAGTVTARFASATGVQPLTFTKDVTAQGGKVAVTLADGETAKLSYKLDGAGPACAGEIALETRLAADGGFTRSSSTFGEWSASGCSLGASVFDPKQRGAMSQPSVTETVAKAWNQATLPGVWDDGKHSSLKLHVAVAASSAPICLSNGHATVPARVTYGTADGRLASLDTAGSVDATFSDRGDVVSLEPYTYDYLACRSPHDDGLPYKLDACSTLDHVELRLDVLSPAQPVTSKGSKPGLTARETARDAANAADAGDSVRTFVLAASP